MQRVISGHRSTSPDQVVKKMILLKVEAADRNCEWTKGLIRHRETWWWNDVSISVKENCKIWKEWKQGNTSNVMCLRL